VSGLATRRNLLIVLIDAGVWASWSALCGYVAHRIPASRLARDRGLLRIRGFEAGGRFYERWLRIKRWKDRLPEAGALFRGGFSKRRVMATDPVYLERFAVETRRAELSPPAPCSSCGTRGGWGWRWRDTGSSPTSRAWRSSATTGLVCCV